MKTYQKTDVGMQRRTNQDIALTYFSEKYVFGAVCDGMGGANAGNVASNIAKDVILRCITRKDIDELDLSGVKSVLRQAVRDANRKIYAQGEKDPGLKGMGTTFCGAASNGRESVILNVGDSRAYLYSNGELRQITRDHSVVEELIALGHITREEAKSHPDKNVITMALGPEEDLLPDVFDLSVSSGDILLLCSDGLSSVVPISGICSAIRENAGDGKKICEELISRANQNGGPDNITVVLIMV